MVRQIDQTLLHNLPETLGESLCEISVENVRQLLESLGELTDHGEGNFDAFFVIEASLQEVHDHIEATKLSKVLHPVEDVTELDIVTVHHGLAVHKIRVGLLISVPLHNKVLLKTVIHHNSEGVWHHSVLRLLHLLLDKFRVDLVGIIEVEEVECSPAITEHLAKSFHELGVYFEDGRLRIHQE